ncbi:MAG: 50S ribosomal protein L2, partial [Candidatus Nanohaloarchaea archaeon]
MGSPLKQQRRGKGSPKFQANRKGKGKADHKNAEITGTVVDLVHDPARTAPVAKVEFSDGEVRNVLAPEGLQTGDDIEVGVSAPVEPGNVLPLG